MVVALFFVEVVAHARVEDSVHTLVQQVFDVAVHQLRRVAGGVGRHRILPLGVQLPRRDVRNDKIKVEAVEKRHPEEQIFVHVQSQRQADHPAMALVSGGVRSTLFADLADLVELVAVHVRQLLVLAQTQRLFTAVAGDVAFAAGKGIDGEVAVVGTALADHRAGLVLEVFQLVPGKHRGAGVLPLVLADALGVDGGAVSAHQPGDIRAGDVVADLLLKAAQHRVV